MQTVNEADDVLLLVQALEELDTLLVHVLLQLVKGDAISSNDPCLRGPALQGRFSSKAQMDKGEEGGEVPLGGRADLKILFFSTHYDVSAVFDDCRS